jgi:hypothetical protein
MSRGRGSTPNWLRTRWRAAAERQAAAEQTAQREDRRTAQRGDAPAEANERRDQALAPAERAEDQGAREQGQPQPQHTRDPDRKQSPEPPPDWRAGGSIYGKRF